jgi:hypothetical protein
LHRTIRGFAAICGATIAVGGAAALSNSVFAQTPAAPAASTATPWTYQGLFDMYYLYDGNSPTGNGNSPTGNVGSGYEYDRNTSTPTLSLAELNIAKAAPANGGIGFKTTLIAGDTAPQNIGGGQEARYEYIQQLYITLAAKSGAGLDIGKFYTPFGYEVTESNANYNYSRSFIFQYLLPVYHTGIRIYSPSYKGLVGTAYVVKSIDNADIGSGDAEGVYDQNKSYGLIGQLNYTAPSGKFTVITTYGASNDGPNGFQDKVKLWDNDITVTPDAVDTFGFNYTNRQDNVETLRSGYANGYAGYYRRQLTAPVAVAFRVEEIQVKAGPADPRIDSLTATLEDKATKSLLVRLEFRHDDAKTKSADKYVFDAGNPFVSGNIASGASTQNTLSLSAVYTFGP